MCVGDLKGDFGARTGDLDVDGAARTGDLGGERRGESARSGGGAGALPRIKARRVSVNGSVILSKSIRS